MMQLMAVAVALLIARSPSAEAQDSKLLSACSGARANATLTVAITTTTHSEEISWQLDHNATTTHLNSDNNGTHLDEAELDYYGPNHTFSFHDSGGDGWHGGYWELINACNRTIVSSDKNNSAY